MLFRVIQKITHINVLKFEHFAVITHAGGFECDSNAVLNYEIKFLDLEADVAF